MPYTIQQMKEALYKADQAGNDDDARVIAAQIKQKMQQQQPLQEGSQGEAPQEGFMQKAANLGGEFLAGAGRGVTGAFEQLVGIGSPSSQKNLEMLGLGQQPTLTKDVLPQKGDIAGEGLATDMAAMAGEFSAPAGLVGRAVGRTPALIEAATGAISGIGAAGGGEVAANALGEDYRGVGEIAGGALAPVGIGNSYVKAGMKKLSGEMSDASAKKSLRDAGTTADDLKSVGRKIYKEIDDLGGFFKADQLQSLSKDLTEKMTEFGISKAGNPRGFGVMSEVLAEATKNQTTKGLDNIRKIASNLSRSADGSEKEAGRLIAESIDDFMLKNSPVSIKTGKNVPEINKKYKDARKIWRQAKKAELIEISLDNASRAASGVQNGIKNEFRSLLKNKKTRNLWTAKEKSAMTKVTDGDLAENTARLLGTFGFPTDQARNWLGALSGIFTGGAAGGGVGAVAIPILGTVSRSLSNKMTANNAKLAKAIITAGDNGVDVVKAYAKNVPKNQRSVEDLSQILARESINKSGLKKFADGTTKETRKLIRDALFFSTALQQNNQEDK